MEDENASAAEQAKGKVSHGHITSISVLREYRKLGIATKLMRACHYAMKTIYKAKYCSLHVRVTNRAAFTLYKDVLGYEVTSVADQYYADKEDAYDMKLFFDKQARDVILKKKPFAEETKQDSSAAEATAESDQTPATQT